MKRVTQSLVCFLLFGYMLGIHGDRIALWKEDDPKPFCVFPYSVSTLPWEEQQRLRGGIRAENAVELTRLLETYLS